MASRLDRISILPDELLVQILSLLPTTRQRAATSLVSRRWRHLWTHVPSIDFTSSDAHRNSYISAVDDSLRLSGASHLIRFHAIVKDVATCRENVHAALDRWIIQTASRSIRELCLEFQWISYANLPRSFLSCSPSLKSLKLVNCDISHLPFDGVVFGSLETMVLKLVRIPSEKFPVLFSACPNLVDLAVIQCGDLNRLELSSAVSPQLVKLTVNGDNLVRVVVDLVSLRYLDISGANLTELRLQGLTHLKEARVHHLTCRHSGWVKETWKPFATAISQVEILAADWSFFQVHKRVAVTFDNLKVLRWNEIKLSGSFKTFMTFIALRCPSLEELHINFNYVGRKGKKSSFQLGKTERMQNYTIKAIRLIALEGRPRDMELIKILLDVSAGLEELYLEFEKKKYMLDSTKKVIFEEISQFPMASQRVKIIGPVIFDPAKKVQLIAIRQPSVEYPGISTNVADLREVGLAGGGGQSYNELRDRVKRLEFMVAEQAKAIAVLTQTTARVSGAHAASSSRVGSQSQGALV